MTKQELIDKCLEQIKTDVLSGDVTAIEELLNFVPTENLKGYLADDAIDDEEVEEVELTPSQMIQQIQIKALQSGGRFSLGYGNAVATSLGYVCEFGKEDVTFKDSTYEDYGNFDDTDIENMYHAIF